MFVTLNDKNKMPLILFGTYLISKPDVLEDCVDAALKFGYRGFDTAAVYRNEKFLGRALRTNIKKYDLKRSDVFVTSKLQPKDQGFDKTKVALELTLENLGMEYLDLYLIHWPGSAKLSKDSPQLKINRMGSWKALEEAQSHGLIKSIGVSNYTIKHLIEMDEYAQIKPAVNQVECHPYLVQSELLEYCNNHQIHMQAYSSLGTTESHDKLLSDSSIVNLAKQINKTPAQVLLKWAVQRGISVLPKSTNAEHIKSNIQLDNWQLSGEQMSCITNLNRQLHFCWNPEEIS